MKRGVLAVFIGVVMLSTGCGAGWSTPASPGVAAAGGAYEEAVLAKRWGAVCALESERLRGTTVARCTAHQAGPDDQDAVRRQAEAAPGAVGVDGSPLPRTGATATMTAAQPAVRQSVWVAASVTVAAAGTHPAGVGLLVEHRAEDGPVARALRLVRQDGRWQVDQVEDIVAAGGGPQAVRAALERE